MQRYRFNKNWEFTFDATLDAYNLDGITKCGAAQGAAERFYEYNHWERIDLPHDFAISLPKDPYADTVLGARNKTHFHRYMTEQHSESDTVYSVGWYRKCFDFDDAWKGKRIFLEFEGIFRDATFWVNGVYMDRHLSGYTGFLLEITDQLHSGEMNSITVRVDADQPEGWWYEGAGIYRNVHLLVGEAVYVKPAETVVKATVDGAVSVSAVLVNDTPEAVMLPIAFAIRDGEGHLAASTDSSVLIPPYAEKTAEATLFVQSPSLWHVDHPNLYTLTLSAGEETHTEVFGFRSFRFDSRHGFFLNGQPLKLRGACVHQDFGGVGVALSDNLQRYKIARLKEMGVNAYRTSHNAPSPAILRACDELGMLVMDETRMFGTSPEALRQLTELVKRDRNHASVFLWSIGNEEMAIQNSDWSRVMAEKACRVVRSLDATRAITYGGNNSDHFEGINGVMSVRGVNYLHNGKIDGYHAAHPEQPIVGTEETSFLVSRGGAINDFGSGLVDSTGSVTMDWGSTPKGFVKYVEERPWYSGAFMWTGFDYRGEPSPFEYTNLSSSFGTIDLCGMEKPPFYYFKAWWTDEPVLKLAPHWNHRDGETVTISTYTNCESVTLFLNGKSLGTKMVEKFDAPLWKIPFEAGTLTAEGVKDGKVFRDTLVTAGKPQSVAVSEVLSAEADGDISVYELSAVDSYGHFCGTAANLVTLSIQNGRIVGVGNGDPSCYDYEQKPREEETYALRLFECENGIYAVPPKQPNVLQNSAYRTVQYRICVREEKADAKPILEDDFRIVAKSNKVTEEPICLTFTTRFSCDGAYEYAEFERLHGEVRVLLDGREIGNNTKGFSKNNRPYRFYADFSKGDHELKVIASFFDNTLGAMSGYCRLGREKHSPYQVRLHYGKARVFVKPSLSGAAVILRGRL